MEKKERGGKARNYDSNRRNNNRGREGRERSNHAPQNDDNSRGNTRVDHSARESRKRVAQDTLEIIESESKVCYVNQLGTTIDMTADLRAAIQNTTLYKPDYSPSVPTSRNEKETQFDVVECTTLEAVEQLIAQLKREDKQKDKAMETEKKGDKEKEGESEQNQQGGGYKAGHRIAVLNFASARNPGGGFLTGAQAQEESLARSSGLYKCLAQDSTYEMYNENSRKRSGAYEHYMIFSRDVPVFKDDQGRYLDNYYSVSFISAPAVNAGVLRSRHSISVADKQTEKAMRERMWRLLSVVAEQQCDILVLGAWGCGVFGNTVEDVARWFYELLVGDVVASTSSTTKHRVGRASATSSAQQDGVPESVEFAPNGAFKNVFKRVVFAILQGRGPPTHKPFIDLFCPTKQ